MKTIQEITKIIKSIYVAPLGSFPRGGIESSLKVSICTAPQYISLRDKGGSLSTFSITGNKYNVSSMVDGVITLSEHEDLQEALEALILPLVRQEIKLRLELVVKP